MALILPNTIANQIPADGDKLQQNFASLQSWANQDAITRDGSTGMVAPLLLPGPPTQPNEAATKQYVDDKTAVANAGFGCSYYHPGMHFTAGQLQYITWPQQNYDAGMGTVNGANFTVPADKGGTYGLTVNMLSHPGAPQVECLLEMTTTPGMQVSAVGLMVPPQPRATFSWIGYLGPGRVFAWRFYNGHPGDLDLEVSMEARWLGH